MKLGEIDRGDLDLDRVPDGAQDTAKNRIPSTHSVTLIPWTHVMWTLQYRGHSHVEDMQHVADPRSVNLLIVNIVSIVLTCFQIRDAAAHGLQIVVFIRSRRREAYVSLLLLWCVEATTAAARVLL